MEPDADLSVVASLIADRHRAQMLQALLGGIPQSGSALASAAGISRSLASAQLARHRPRSASPGRLAVEEHR